MPITPENLKMGETRVKPSILLHDSDFLDVEAGSILLYMGLVEGYSQLGYLFNLINQMPFETYAENLFCRTNTYRQLRIRRDGVYRLTVPDNVTKARADRERKKIQKAHEDYDSAEENARNEFYASLRPNGESIPQGDDFLVEVKGRQIVLSGYQLSLLTEAPPAPEGHYTSD
jgi:hypothetical protein